MSGKYIVVNELDEIIGYKSDAEKSPTAIERVTGLFLYNANHEVLLSKRMPNKRHDPNKWSIAVCGTVEEGETYLSNIIKETEEEIGLRLLPEDIQEHFYGLWESTHKFFYKQYHAEIRASISELVPQPDEVAELRFVPAAEFFDWVKNRPDDFVTSMPKVLAILRRTLGW